MNEMSDLLENKSEVWIDMNPHHIFRKRFEDLSLEKYRSNITEQDALMFLTLIRKIDESLFRPTSSGFKNTRERVNKSREKSNYIRFFCDWAVHANLTRSDLACDVLYRLNKIRFTKSDSEDSISNFVATLYEVIDFSTLRSQIRDLFVISDKHRPPLVVGSDASWYSFCSALLRLLEGARLHLADHRKEYKDLIGTVCRDGATIPEAKIINSIWIERDYGNERCFVLKAQQKDTTKIVHYVNIVDRSKDGKDILLSSHCQWR